MPEERGDEQARDGHVVALPLLRQRARMAGQVGDLVARVQRHRAQRAFGRTVVLAAEDLEGAVRVPVAVGTFPADLGIAAEAVTFTHRCGIRSEVKAVHRPPDPFHVALPVRLLSAGVCDKAYWAVVMPSADCGAVLHASAAAKFVSAAQR